MSTEGPVCPHWQVPRYSIFSSSVLLFLPNHLPSCRLEVWLLLTWPGQWTRILEPTRLAKRTTAWQGKAKAMSVLNLIYSLHKDKMQYWRARDFYTVHTCLGRLGVPDFCRQVVEVDDLGHMFLNVSYHTILHHRYVTDICEAQFNKKVQTSNFSHAVMDSLDASCGRLHGVYVGSPIKIEPHWKRRRKQIENKGGKEANAPNYCSYVFNLSAEDLTV